MTGASRARPIAERARDALGAVGVRTKILGIVLSLTIVLGLGITWQVRAVMNRVLIDELASRGVSVASDVAARSVDPILLNDTFAVYRLLVQTIDNNPDLVYAFVVAPNGAILAHTFGDTGFPTQLLDITRNAGQTVFDSSQGRIHDFAMSIFNGQAGTAHVGLSETRLQGVIDTVTGQMLLTTLVVALVGIGAAIFLTWILTRPIVDLVDTTRRIGAGDLTARARLWSPDEIGTLAEAFNTMIDDLERSRMTIAEKEAARTRLLEKIITAQEEERKRIARELHDGVGQTLNSLALGISALSQTTEPAESSRTSQELRTAIAETLQTVRQMSRDLRPSTLDDLGLAEAIRHYGEEFRTRHPGIRVDMHLDVPGRLSPSVETAVYRIVQEGMTNAGRHSRGSMVSVVVARRDGHLQAIIEDDGCGFDVGSVVKTGTSVGIHAIRERAELVGGKATFESGPQGTTVFIEVPI